MGFFDEGGGFDSLLGVAGKGLALRERFRRSPDAGTGGAVAVPVPGGTPPANPTGYTGSGDKPAPVSLMQYAPHLLVGSVVLLVVSLALKKLTD